MNPTVGNPIPTEVIQVGIDQIAPGASSLPTMNQAYIASMHHAAVIDLLGHAAAAIKVQQA